MQQPNIPSVCWRRSLDKTLQGKLYVKLAFVTMTQLWNGTQKPRRCKLSLEVALGQAVGRVVLNNCSRVELSVLFSPILSLIIPAILSPGKGGEGRIPLPGPICKTIVRHVMREL